MLQIYLYHYLVSAGLHYACALWMDSDKPEVGFAHIKGYSMHSSNLFAWSWLNHSVQFMHENAAATRKPPTDRILEGL